ncbi:MAG: DapH/DapD/GlmU-related protein [Pseudomonadota bacterium]
MTRNLGFPPFVSEFSGIDRMGVGCQISTSVSIMRNLEPLGKRCISLGDDVMLFDQVRLLLGCNLTPDNSGLLIGNRVIVNVGCYISGEGGLVIDDDAIIGANVHILSAGHSIHNSGPVVSVNPLEYGAIHIGVGSWIGANSTILPGVKIGRGAVVGAGSVVTRAVPSFTVAVGNPARVIHYREGYKPKRWWHFDRRAVT